MALVRRDQGQQWQVDVLEVEACSRFEQSDVCRRLVWTKIGLFKAQTCVWRAGGHRPTLARAPRDLADSSGQLCPPETRARASAVAGAIRTDGCGRRREAAARRGQRRKAASVRVNHAGSSSHGRCPAPGCTANSPCSNRPEFLEDRSYAGSETALETGGPAGSPADGRR